MARVSNIDTERQEFLKENYRKENILRNAWFQSYFGSNDLPADVSGPRTVISPIPDSMKAGKPNLIKIKPAPATPPKRPVAAAPPTKPLDPNVKLSEMRPATPETKNMIYSGLSAEGDGRKAYLKKRLTKAPEDKFEFPLTSSLEVGWNIQEVAKKMEKLPVYGKSRIVRDTFFAENGVM